MNRKPCKARANQSELNELPKAKSKVDKNKITKPPNIGTV
jgi:hypothetical protein